MPKTSEKILEILQRLEKKVENLEKQIKNLSTNNEQKNKVKKTTKSAKKVTKIIKSGKVTLTRHPNGITVTGDTYDKRHIIKKFSGWWTPECKGWTVRLNKYSGIKDELELYSEIVYEKESSNKLKIDDFDKTVPEKQTANNTAISLDFLSDDDD